MIKILYTSLIAHHADYYFTDTVHSPAPIFSSFINWCESQQENRLLWLMLALTAHAAVFTPLTVSVILLSGVHFFWLMLAMVAIAIAVVVNLALLPTKITVPVFALNIFIDLAIVTLCFIHIFNN